MENDIRFQSCYHCDGAHDESNCPSQEVRGEEQDFPCGKPENHNNYEQGNCAECVMIKYNI